MWLELPLSHPGPRLPNLFIVTITLHPVSIESVVSRNLLEGIEQRGPEILYEISKSTSGSLIHNFHDFYVTFLYIRADFTVATLGDLDIHLVSQASPSYPKREKGSGQMPIGAMSPQNVLPACVNKNNT